MENEQMELIPKDIIRTETALSRFPIHCLAKQSNISIRIKETNEEGEAKTEWKVSYNSEHGQPSQLAYKLDTIIINRRIDEIGRPVPKIIKLGSLRELCEMAGLNPEGKNTQNIKKALHQNASAYITAKINYKQIDGTERRVEAGFTRYSIIFTGEELPDGSKADGIHLLLNEIYQQIINSAITRPLDYDYLKELPPTPQRFYELLSYKMFAAVKNNLPYAEMLYSEFCTYAPQTRHRDYDRVKKQMYKIHKPHLQSGYIAKVSLIEIRTENDEADWRMRYTPGLKARGEHKAANDKPKLSVNRKDLFKEKRKNLKSENQPSLLGEIPSSKDEITENLISQLKTYGVAETTARELVKSHRIAAEAQIRAYPYREGGKPKTNAAGWLIAAIKANYELPLAYLEAEEQKQTALKAKEARAARESCQLCDENGYRRIFNDRYPSGAMKRCTHDPEVENKIPSRQQK